MATVSQTNVADALRANDPEIFSGEMEIYVTPPFDSAHIIQVMRQLQKYGCLIRYSSGSFRDGCLMAVSVDEATDVVSILSEVPGTKEVKVTHRPVDMLGLSGSQPLQRLLDADADVCRIAITAQPRTSADADSPGSRVRNSKGGRELASDKSDQMDNGHDTAPSDRLGGYSENGWARRLTYDIRNTALKRTTTGGGYTGR